MIDFLMARFLLSVCLLSDGVDVSGDAEGVAEEVGEDMEWRLRVDGSVDCAGV